MSLRRAGLQCSGVHMVVSTVDSGLQELQRFEGCGGLVPLEKFKILVFSFCQTIFFYLKVSKDEVHIYNTQCSLFNWYSTYYSKSLFVTNNFKTLQHYYLLPRTEPETSLPFQNSHKTLTKHACKNGGMEILVLVACRKYYREKRQLIADYRVQSPFWTAS